VNFTLLGALRSLDAVQRRSDFYRAWETALRASKDVRLSLDTMGEGADGTLEEARNYLLEGIAKGRPVGVIAKLRPDLFPVLDQLLLASGESFGTLPDSLRLLSEYYLRDFTRYSRIRAWVGAPLVIAVLATFVLPLPLLWDVSSWAYSSAIIGGVLFIYLLGGIPVSLLYSSAKGMQRVQRPRFAWTLAMGLEGGLTFAGAARLAATTSGMDAVAKHLDAIPAKTLKASSLSKMLEGSPVWPAMTAQVRKADEASEYLSTLRVFAEHLESPP
jgi:type II secretory pathway component PulF